MCTAKVYFKTPLVFQNKTLRQQLCCQRSKSRFFVWYSNKIYFWHILTSDTVSHICVSGSFCLRYTLIFFLRRIYLTTDNKRRTYILQSTTLIAVLRSHLTVWGAIVLNRRLVFAVSNIEILRKIILGVFFSYKKVSEPPWSFTTKVVVLKRGLVLF